MKAQLKIKICLACGSGEKVYDRDAMHRIKERSPALGKAYRKKAA